MTLKADLPQQSPFTNRPWMLRSPSWSEPVQVRWLTTLLRWIVELRVDRNYEISRDGIKWATLGEIPDLAPFFNLVEHAYGTVRVPPKVCSGEICSDDILSLCGDPDSIGQHASAEPKVIFENDEEETIPWRTFSDRVVSAP